MNEGERELLLKHAGEIGLLKVQVDALQELVIALAIALTEKPNASLKDAVKTMEFVRKLKEFTKGKDIAESMKYVIENLRALSNTDPIQVLLVQAFLYHQAGDSKRNALQSWLGIATVDEIGQDVWLMLQSFLDQPRPETGEDEIQDDDVS